MSMQALNHLVAHSIVDPNVVAAFTGGRIGEVLGELDFTPELRKRLAALQAATWAEFAVLAYRLVQAISTPAPRIQLPSPLEGLLPKSRRADEEQVA
jgi:hypothetical protein